jgi:hypothetical protein
MSYHHACLRIDALVLNVLFPFRCFFLSVESETTSEINANTDQINYIEEQGKRKPFDAFPILCLQML